MLFKYNLLFLICKAAIQTTCVYCLEENSQVIFNIDFYSAKHGASNFIEVETPVSFDATASKSIIGRNLTLRFTWDDGMEPSIVKLSSEPYQHVFHSSGNHKIRVDITDNTITEANEPEEWLTLYDGKSPVPYRTLDCFVNYNSPSCYKFHLFMLNDDGTLSRNNLSPSSSMSVYAQVTMLLTENDTIDYQNLRSKLSKEFSSQGMIPSYSISILGLPDIEGIYGMFENSLINTTQGLAWKVTFESPPYFGPLAIQINSKGVISHGCSVETSHFNLQGGHSIVNGLKSYSSVLNEIAGHDDATVGSIVNGLHNQNTSMTMQSHSTYGANQNYIIKMADMNNKTKDLLVLTDGAFEQGSNILFDLFNYYDSFIATDTYSPNCNQTDLITIAECSPPTIVDIVLLPQRYIVATWPLGLIEITVKQPEATTTSSSSSPSSNGLEFKRLNKTGSCSNNLKTPCAADDDCTESCVNHLEGATISKLFSLDAATLRKWKETSFYIQYHISDKSHSMAYCRYDIITYEPRFIYFDVSNLIIANAFSRTYMDSSNSQTDTTTIHVLSAARDLYRSTHVLLISDIDNGSRSKILIVEEANTYEAGSPLLVYKAGFEFKSSEVVTNIRFLSMNAVLLATGGGVWASLDGGKTFLSRFLLEDDEFVVQVTSSFIAAQFAILTSKGRILYGTSMERHIAVLRGIQNSNLDKINHVSFDNSGFLWKVSFRTLLASSNRNIFMPFEESLGLVNESSNSNSNRTHIIVSRHPIPVKTLIESSRIIAPDSMFDVSMQASWHTGNIRVYFRHQNGSLYHHNTGADSGGSNTNWPAREHLGLVLNLPDGGSIRLTSISDEEALFVGGEVIEPLMSCDGLNCPAISMDLSLVSSTDTYNDETLWLILHSPISISNDNNNNTIINTTASSTWRLSDRSKTIFLSSGSIFVTEIFNTTHAKGISTNQLPDTSMYTYANNWKLIDLRLGRLARQEASFTTVSTGYNVTVIQNIHRVENNTFEVQFSQSDGTGVNEFDLYQYIGSIFTTENGWGSIIKVTDPMTAILLSGPSPLGLETGDYNTRQWSIYHPSDWYLGANTFPIPSKSPYLSIPKCSYNFFMDNIFETFPTKVTLPIARPLKFDPRHPHRTLTSIDIGKDVEIRHTVEVSSSEYLTTRFGAREISDSNQHCQSTQSNVGISVINNAGIYFNGSVANQRHDSRAEYTEDSSADIYRSTTETVSRITVSNLEADERTLVVFSPMTDALRCTRKLYVKDLYIGCPFGSILTVDIEMSPSEFLKGEQVSEIGSRIVELLPINYRPPSSLGAVWPTTPHVYNADPSLPLDNDFFPQSTSIASYKQCKEKPNREACGCTDNQRISSLVANSDCIDRAIRVYHGKIYRPNLVVYQMGKELDHDWNFIIEEVNMRTDWCYKKKSCSASISPTKLYSLTYNATDDEDGIMFSGEGLYHFLARVRSGDTFCTLSAEFTVFVSQAPLSTSSIFVTISSTAVICGLILLVVFTLYNIRRNVYVRGSHGYQRLEVAQ